MPFVFSIAGCNSHDSFQRSIGTAFGTSYRIIFAQTVNLSRAQKTIDSILQTVDKTFSTWRPDSWLSQLNQAKAGHALVVPDIALPLLQQSSVLSRETSGRFDITSLPLLSLWGFGPQARLGGEPPSAQKIEAVLPLIGASTFTLDSVHKTITKHHDAVQFDLSAIAKGYAVDLIASALRSRGIDNFLVEIGGDLYASGAPKGRTAWSVKVPHQTTSRYIVEISNKALATSGAEHHAKAGVCHIINPLSGYALPIITPVTVTAASAVKADALSTAKAVASTEFLEPAL